MANGCNDAQRVATELRRAIRDGELLPGEHVRQEVWASNLSVSRVPVREALKLLSAECIVEHSHNRGFFVTKIDDVEMAQIYRMRILLEPEVLRSIRVVEGSEIVGLQDMTDKTVGLLTERRIIDALHMDRQFYFCIYELSPLRYIIGEVERLWSMADAYRRASILVELAADPAASEFRRRHEAIMNAIADHDSEELVRIVIDERMGVLSRLTGRVSPGRADLVRGLTP